ncbi:hypothetical protein GALMADRAFT_119335 [Galerina marginata CBS 339.88]|uniref:Fe2OG dioxygenase domain-containing protein n=1 Tax=Galerina marginata (strain CBS 339.88) TaxID=685588 RepID=A0A067T534_GALM3|nr:hypothetical protein GALMADRAFT_119335 [Galerina marginata CBS 339.88]
MDPESNIDSLFKRRITGHEGAFYLPNFITPEEEEYIIQKIHNSPQPQWKNLANRRLQIWGGDITAKGTLISQPLPSFMDKFPDIVSRIKATGVFNDSPHNGPNHVIMNEYLPGQGIMPHEDGPRYHPVVATLSLGSHAIFHYYRYQQEIEDDAVSRGHGRTIDMIPVASVLLEPRSLIISTNTMYISHLHGIEDVEEDLIASRPGLPGVNIANLTQVEDSQLKQSIDQGIPLQRRVRYSLTCRDVRRVSLVNSFSRR